VNNPRDSLMPERGTLSVDKARRLLGYDPQYSLDKGFVQYIQWYKKLAEDQPELFRAE
jgi:nucleoside-diphosphate-sugar epimerase